MPKFKIPVSYQMIGYLEIEADTEEEAVKKADKVNTSDVLESEYLCSSWEVDDEKVKSIRLKNRFLEIGALFF